MSTNELLLLGLLGLQRMHGYEIHEFLERRLGFLTDLKRPTAYRLLETLEAHGLVESSVERLGRRPERRVYRLTPHGRERLLTLLRSELAEPSLVPDPGNVALLFAEHLPPEERAVLLDRRRSSLLARRDRLAGLVGKHSPRTSARLVLEHDLARVDAEIAWLASAAPAIVDLASPTGQAGVGETYEAPVR